ncbi:6521_t:CDS:1, partial [Dentiscutata heterogama]
MTYKKSKGIVKKPAVLQTKKYKRSKVPCFCSTCNGQERDPRVKAEHEAQEQKPFKKHIISNHQVRYQLRDTSNGEGSSNMINEVALLDQDIGLTGGELSDSETYNFIPLSQPENL